MEKLHTLVDIIHIRATKSMLNNFLQVFEQDQENLMRQLMSIEQ